MKTKRQDCFGTSSRRTSEIYCTATRKTVLPPTYKQTGGDKIGWKVGDKAIS